MNTAETDSELIKRVKKGEHIAYKALVDRYQGRVAATITGMLGKTAEVEDVGQEVFIRFFKSIDSFREESGVGTYITRIAINLSLNEIKKQKRGRLVLSNYAEESKRENLSADIHKGDDDENEAERVIDLVQELKPKYRAVLVLRLIDGYSTREAADILKVPLGTVLSRLTRAQSELRKIFKRKSIGVEYAE